VSAHTVHTMTPAAWMDQLQSIWFVSCGGYSGVQDWHFKTCLCLEQKYTYTYNSLQFPAEMKTSGSKTPTTFITLHINYDYR